MNERFLLLLMMLFCKDHHLLCAPGYPGKESCKKELEAGLGCITKLRLVSANRSQRKAPVLFHGMGLVVGVCLCTFLICKTSVLLRTLE